jgi:hypothetical protein
MKASIMFRMLWIAIFALIANVSFAGGRYADPPMNLGEVYKATQTALEAAKAGNKDAALESANQGRKLAVTSFKEKSTMPMQIASSYLKEAVALLEAGNMGEAIPKLEHVITKCGEEIDYYKKEGKM